MNRLYLEQDWPDSWKRSFKFDLEEIYGVNSNRGYANAYRVRRDLTVRLLKTALPEGGSILDVAGAQGNFSLTLAEIGYDVTWNDLREDLAGYVRLKHTEGNVKYAPGNILNLTFNTLFDAVLIAEVIEHVAHPDQFLIDVSRLVRPGGYIVISTPNGAYFRNRLPKFSDCPDPTAFEKVQFQPDADGHIFLLHPDELVSIANQACLRVDQTLLCTNPLTRGFLKTDRILEFLPQKLIDGLEQGSRRLPPFVQKPLFLQIVARLQKPLGDPDVGSLVPPRAGTNAPVKGASRRLRIFLRYHHFRVKADRIVCFARKVPGANAAYRLISRRLFPTEPVMVEVDGLRMFVKANDSVGAALLVNGSWEEYESQLFTEFIKPGMVVVDCGANVGFHTLLAARGVGDSGKVVAFEPDPINFGLLNRNVEANGFSGRVILINAALSDHAGSAQLFSDSGNSGNHSLDSSNVHLGEGSVTVPLVRLSDALVAKGIDKVDVMKMDVQGSEGLLLSGFNSLMDRNLIAIFTEFWPYGLRNLGTNPVDFINDLRRKGFTLKVIDQKCKRLEEVGEAQDLVDRCPNDRDWLDLLVERNPSA